MERIIKSMENKYLLSSLELVQEDLFNDKGTGQGSLR